MSERKSSRSRKSICYATQGDESDDDFAPSPSSKKQKTHSKREDKEKKKDASKSSSSSFSTSLTTIPSSILKRQSNFDHELQQALKLSMRETSSSQDISDSDANTGIKVNPESKDNHVHLQDVEVDIEPLPSAPHLDKVVATPTVDVRSDSDISPNPPKLVPVATSICAAIMDDTIEFVESVTETGRRQKKMRESASRRMTSKKFYIDDDEDRNSEAGSDFIPDEGNGSDDQEEEDDDDDAFSPSDNDSDFDDGKSKAKKKKVQKNSPVLKNSSLKSEKATSSNVKSWKSSMKERTKVTNPVVKDNVVKTSIARKAPSLGVMSPLSNTATTTGNSPSSCTSDAAIAKTTPALSSPGQCHSSAITKKAKNSSPLPISRSVSTPSPRCVISRQWKPPGQSTNSSTSSGSGSLLKSPSSGLRLGLSRNQRVKPLHSSVNVV